MDAVRRLIDAAMPACIAVGPFFMIMAARGDTDRRARLTRVMNFVGLGMVMAVLFWSNFQLRLSHHRIGALNLEVQYLQERVKALEASGPSR